MIDETVESTKAPFDFSKEKPRYDRIISDFSDEQDKVKERRKVRENKRNVIEERQKKTILPDETIIPDRTINTNIRIGRSSYVSYITQAKRLLIVTDIGNPGISVAPLEEWFTRGMRYPDWKFPWFEAIDCMHTHGGAAMEVVYDSTKPLNCSIEYIPRENLLFPKKTKNLQGCPHLLRAYDLTTLELEEFGDEHGFDELMVKELLEKHQKADDFVTIYRVLCKKMGIVYNSWYSKEMDRNWLREPIVHNIGLLDFEPQALVAEIDGLPLFMSPIWEQEELLRQNFAVPLQLKQYPIFWLPYEITENQTLLEGQGRVALDIHVQEALTSMITSTVNGANRASKFYPCLKNDPTNDPGGMEMQMLAPGEIYPREIAQFQPNWPNNVILAVIQALQIGKANEAGHSDYAAMARKDANKTATEMELAQNQAQTTISSDMDVFSSPVLKLFGLCFEIARHQAIFALCQRPAEPSLLLGTYNLVPAGDVEVVKRLEDKQNAKEFFNIVQGTPAAEKILIFLIERFFPDQAAEWIAALSGPNKDAIIAELVKVLVAIQQDMKDELTTDQHANLANVIAAASSVVDPGNNPTLLNPPGVPEQQAPRPNPANKEAA